MRSPRIKFQEVVEMVFGRNNSCWGKLVSYKQIIYIQHILQFSWIMLIKLIHSGNYIRRWLNHNLAYLKSVSTHVVHVVHEQENSKWPEFPAHCYSAGKEINSQRCFKLHEELYIIATWKQLYIKCTVLQIPWRHGTITMFHLKIQHFYKIVIKIFYLVVIICIWVYKFCMLHIQSNVLRQNVKVIYSVQVNLSTKNGRVIIMCKFYHVSVFILACICHTDPIWNRLGKTYFKLKNAI